MNNTIHDQTEDYIEISRTTVRWSMFYVLITFIVAALTFALAAGLSGWQVTVLRLSVTVALALSIYGTTQIFRKQLDAGLTYLVAGVLIMLLSLSTFVQGLGFLTVFLIIPLLAFTVSPTSSAPNSGKHISVGFAVGVIGLIIDVFAGDADFRFRISQNIETVISVATALLFLINIWYVASKFQEYSMRTKLVVSFVFVTVVSLGTLGILNDRSTRLTLTNEANEALFAAASQTENSIVDMLRINLASVENEARLPVFRNFLLLPSSNREGSNLYREVTETLVALSGKDIAFITSYTLLDINGIVVADTDSSQIGIDKSDRQYFQAVINTGKVHQSEMIISPENGQASLYFASPVKNNETIGVLRVRYDAAILQSLIERSNNLVGEDSFGVLFDEYFIHLAHGLEPETTFTTVVPLEPDLFDQLVLAGRLPNLPTEELFLNLPELAGHLLTAQTSDNRIEFFDAEDVATGNRRLQAVVLAFEESEWLLVFFQPEDVFLAPADAQTNLLLIISIITALIVVAASFWLAQLLSTPIVELTSVAAQVSEGNLDIKANVSGSDEISILATTFNSMTDQMGTLISGLEDQVSERTKALQERAGQLQAATEIARDATSELELETLLDRAVNLTRSRFSLNFVGIHLFGIRKENIYLRAGVSNKGKELTGNTRRISVRGDALIAQVASSGEPLNIFGDAIQQTQKGEIKFADSRSWLGLAMRVGQDIIGVMEFQSIQEDAFQENEITLLQTLADQLANAIQKNELRQEIEQALKDAEAAYGQFTEKGWDEYSLGKDRTTGYSFDQRETTSVKGQSKEATRAWQLNEVVTSAREDDDSSGLAVPMKVRGKTIGVLNLEFDKAEVPQESEEFIVEVANRLGLVFENARLLDTTRERVERERLLADVTSNFRENLNIDEILKSAVEAIGKKFDIDAVEIRLGDGTSSAVKEKNNSEISSAEND